MIKRKALLITSSLLLTTIGTSPAMAATSSNVPQGVYNQNTYNSLINDGLSSNDAQYYATLQSKLKNLINNHQRINLSGVNPLPQSVVDSDPSLMKQDILKLDPSAILSALHSTALTEGMSDLNKLEQQNPGQKTYMIQYPDGSSMTLIAGTGETKSLRLSGNSNSPTVIPQGWQSSTFGSGNAEYSGTGFSVTVTLSTPGSFSQNTLANINYTADPQDANGNIIPEQPTITSYLPGNSSVGIIGISNVTASTDSPGSLEEEAYNDTLFTVSGAISLGGDGLGLSFNESASWSQYADFLVDGNNDEYYDIAKTYT